jgi:hypothetical protein
LAILAVSLFSNQGVNVIQGINVKIMENVANPTYFIYQPSIFAKVGSE